MMNGMVLASLMRPSARTTGSCAAAFFRASRVRLDFVIVAAGTQDLEFLRLVAAHGLVNIERVHLFLFDGKIIHADHDLLFGLHRALILVRSFGNFFLREAILNGLDHAAHGVEPVKVVERALLHIERELFQEVRAGQRIDGLRHAGFVGNDLLRAQRDARRFLRGQRQRLVV